MYILRRLVKLEVQFLRLDFKSGSFKIPLKSKCDIIPICVFNTEYVFDDVSKEKEKIYISFLPKITYEEYKDLKTNDISKLVQKQIQNEFNKLNYSYINFV